MEYGAETMNILMSVYILQDNEQEYKYICSMYVAYSETWVGYNLMNCSEYIVYEIFIQNTGCVNSLFIKTYNSMQHIQMDIDNWNELPISDTIIFYEC